MPAPPAPADGVLTRALAANFRFVTSAAGFHLLVGAFVTAAFVLRAFLFPGIGGDDGEQLVFAQFLAGGYQTRNPPLYTWLVILVQSALGVGIAATLAVRFVLLGLIYVLLHGVARIVI